jgi:hypothetical protein
MLIKLLEASSILAFYAVIGRFVPDILVGVKLGSANKVSSFGT